MLSLVMSVNAMSAESPLRVARSIKKSVRFRRGGRDTGGAPVSVPRLPAVAVSSSSSSSSRASPHPRMSGGQNGRRCVVGVYTVVLYQAEVWH